MFLRAKFAMPRPETHFVCVFRFFLGESMEVLRFAQHFKWCTPHFPFYNCEPGKIPVPTRNFGSTGTLSFGVRPVKASTISIPLGIFFVSTFPFFTILLVHSNGSVYLGLRVTDECRIMSSHFKILIYVLISILGTPF